MVRKKINMLLVVGMAMSSVAPVAAAAQTKDQFGGGFEQAREKDEFKDSAGTRWERIARGPQTLYNAWCKQNVEEAVEGVVGCCAYALGLYATYRLGASFMGGASAKPVNPINPTNLQGEEQQAEEQRRQAEEQRVVAEEQRRAEVERQVRAQAERQAQAEEQRRVEVERQVRAEAERQAQVEVERQAQAEAERHAEELTWVNEQLRLAGEQDVVGIRVELTEEQKVARRAEVARERAEQRRQAGQSVYWELARNGVESTLNVAGNALNTAGNALGSAANTTAAEAAFALGRRASHLTNLTATGAANGGGNGVRYLRRRGADAWRAAIHTTPRQAALATVAGVGYVGNRFVDGVQRAADTKAGHVAGAVARATANGVATAGLTVAAYGIVLPGMVIAQMAHDTGMVALAAGEVYSAAGARNLAAIRQWGLDTYRYYRPGAPVEAAQDAGQADVVEADVLALEHVAWLADQVELCEIDRNTEVEVPFRDDLSHDENRALRMQNDVVAVAGSAAVFEVVPPVARNNNVEAGVRSEEQRDDVDGSDDEAACMAGICNAAVPYLRSLVLKIDALPEHKKVLLFGGIWMSPLIVYQFSNWLLTVYAPSAPTSTLILLPSQAVASSLTAATFALIKRALADQGAHNEGAHYMVDAGAGLPIDFPGLPTGADDALTTEMMGAGASELFGDLRECSATHNSSDWNMMSDFDLED